MRNIFLYIFILSPIILLSQTEKVKFKGIIDKGPLIGATISVKENELSHYTYTDLDGYAELDLNGQEAIRISYLGPYTELQLKQPVDSVYIDLDKRKATFYYKGEKKKSRKIKIER